MAAFPLMLPGTSRPPKLVVFDLDHTLIACDATILWTEFLYEKKIVTDPIWRQYDRDMVKSYAKGVLDIRDFCRKHSGGKTPCTGSGVCQKENCAAYLPGRQEMGKECSAGQYPCLCALGLGSLHCEADCQALWTYRCDGD